MRPHSVLALAVLAVCSLGDRNGPLWLLAPPGEVRVYMTRPVGGLGVERRPHLENLSSVTIDIEVGQETRVRLVEPERPTNEELLGGR